MNLRLTLTALTAHIVDGDTNYWLIDNLKDHNDCSSKDEIHNSYDYKCNKEFGHLQRTSSSNPIKKDKNAPTVYSKRIRFLNKKKKKGQVQWQSFETCKKKKKKASFELETSNQCFFNFIFISASRICNLFLNLGMILNWSQW